ncbi:uncharacterized protein AB675_2609 [Cyphellophora attinorum]|uniref:Tubulin-specific chaperone A n=1 Tax=Cyphellophora attinorum TaxID=1664694 RepID=A0A0N1HGW4_9EURO|nr:uncharacterized protein AB675_2609 [Phialophora attinorum]KPI44990.1 hypothetical protein AB675_2609 [Phialophora attinorum]
MAPPSQLQIALSALQRLVKEEASYYKEMNQQKSRIAKLEATNGDATDGDGNEEYQLKQEKKALEETKAVIPGLREKITNAREKTETLLDSAASEEEKQKAIDVLREAKELQKDDPVS